MCEPTRGELFSSAIRIKPVYLAGRCRNRTQSVGISSRSHNHNLDCSSTARPAPRQSPCTQPLDISLGPRLHDNRLALPYQTIILTTPPAESEVAPLRTCPSIRHQCLKPASPQYICIRSQRTVRTYRSTSTRSWL